MAPISMIALLYTILRRDDDTGVASSCDDTVGPCIEVVCAWPLSGQYGFGQRILYYILVVVCVVARKEEWTRAVCQAAALLVPAVAAVHGIVLTSFHVDGATDMDIYGALQFCSIGILAAPVTVKLSSTFFYDPGRNIIFLWTGLILSGLMSLAVEFYRSNTHPCQTGGASPVPSFGRFPYGDGDICGLVCSQASGPFSSLRQGPTSEIYVVPKPATLPFGMAMFLAAAECVPAILSLVSMWNKILEINWKARRGRGGPVKEQPEDHGIIPGTNGATMKGMKDVNQAIRSLLSAVEVPVLGGAWIAVLIIGEINFWSPQVRYHTEPISSIEAGLSTADSTGEWVARRKIANALGKIGNYFGNPAKDPFGAGDFRTGAWPRIPGEAQRNDRMAEHDDRYSIMEGPSSPLDSQDGGPSSESVSVSPTPASPTSPTSLPYRARGSRKHANSFPSRMSSRHSSFDHPRPAGGSHDPGVRTTERRATLEVPPSAHHR
ncbi:hypothetical protein LA080_014552 [Diaporthe eres]|nr:hypothetical protein LA080_014552 [Diaporthe eres]